MERFALMLESGLKESGETVELLRPKVFFGRLPRTTVSGFGKWLGYLDKWILFPFWIRGRRWASPVACFHVCDHSNAPYLAHLPKERSSITCHDVLAIRGALGYSDENHCPASRSGKILQKWILANLSKARRIGVDSEESMRQLLEVSRLKKAPEGWRVIHVGLNPDFVPMDGSLANEYLDRVGIDANQPFVLHVGSSHPRKNRRMLLRMVASLGQRWTGKICFAGQAMDESLRLEAAALEVLDRIVEVVSPENPTLVALYSRCEAFVFPSYSEGFGWPVLEAQGCGTPVIATSVEPTPEVAGGAALFASPDSVEQFVEAFLRLQDPTVRSSLIQRGFENAKRFAPEYMAAQYRRLMTREDSDGS